MAAQSCISEPSFTISGDLIKYKYKLTAEYIGLASDKAAMKWWGTEGWVDLPGLAGSRWFNLQKIKDAGGLVV